jgi:hypothetical protein
MFAQVDNEGNHFLLLQEITDHKKDHSAIPISEGTGSANGQAKPKVRQDERMVPAGAMERRFYQLGKVNGPQGI